MKSLVRPELPTASACSSQATSAAVDNSAPVQTRPFSLIYRGLAVQTNRATSRLRFSQAVFFGRLGLHPVWLLKLHDTIRSIDPKIRPSGVHRD